MTKYLPAMKSGPVKSRIVKWILFAVLFLAGSCEKDVLENYRANFTGDFTFTTIREDLTAVPSEIIDTLYHHGTIGAIYSNRTDLIRIEFTGNTILNAAVSPGGSLSLPSTLSTGAVETLQGFFTDGNKRVVFDYRISSGIDYSVNHRVEGLRQ